MNDYLSAALIGLTYGNLWVCALLVFSLQTTKKLISIGFLLGRSIAIFMLSLLITLIGRVISIPYWLLQIISGVVVIGYAVYTIVRFVILRKHNDNRSSANVEIYDCTKTNAHLGCHTSTDSVNGSQESINTHNCAACPIHLNNEYHQYCDSCGDETCLYETNEFKNVKGKQKSGFIFGMTVGALRGGVLCSKLLILAPILTRSSFGKSMLISLLFIISSSIYPILGLFVGKLALKFVKFKKALIIAGTILLLLVGAYYIYQGIAIIMSNLSE